MFRTQTVFLLWVTLSVILSKSFCSNPKKLFETDIERLRSAIAKANTAIRKATGKSDLHCPSEVVPKYELSKAEKEFDDYLNNSMRPYLFR